MTTLPAFPTDPATLDAVEHALWATLDGAGEVQGADYTLHQLLDAYSEAPGEDGLVLLNGDQALSDLGIGDRPTYYDDRPRYSERGLIAALIAVVRRLRETGEGE